MAKGTIKRVTVNDRKYSVDMARANSWAAVKLLAKLQGEKDVSKQGAYAIQYADYVLGDAMSDVVDACGGDGAPADAVITLAFEVIAAASKN